MRVDYSLLFGFAVLMVLVESRSITLLDNQDTEMLGEDSQIPRKIIAPLLTEEELRETEVQQPRRTFQLNIRPIKAETPQIDSDTRRQIDEYSEDPFELSKEQQD